MNHEEHDNLWELLGKAKPAEASPFFSRNVLRAIRGERQARTGFVAWLLSRWGLALAGACAVVVAGFVLMPRSEPADSLEMLVETVTASPDYHVISNLDELLESQASSVWLDTSVY